MRQAKNLAKWWDGPGQAKFGTERAGTAKIWDWTWDKMGQSRKGCSKTEKDVLKQENDVLKQEIWSFLKNFNSFCPGMSWDRGVCPGFFAPALVQGQRDTGTRILFSPGTKGQRDVQPTRDNSGKGDILRHIFTIFLAVISTLLYSGGHLYAHHRTSHSCMGCHQSCSKLEIRWYSGWENLEEARSKVTIYTSCGEDL